MARNWLERHDYLLALLLGVGMLVVYWISLSPGVEGGDPGEFQFVPYVLGIPHQTGYPLYVLLGKLWTLVPFGSVAYRMNLFSAVFGALTVALMYLVVRLLCGSPWAAAFSALGLGLNRLFWLWATMAGVRAMNAFFFALILWVALNWHRRQSTKWLYLLALVCGLSLAHHRTALLALPALIVFVVWADGNALRSPRVVLTALALSVAPLLLYVYVLVRGMSNPPFSALPITGLRSALDLVIAGGTMRSLRLLDWPGGLLGLTKAVSSDFGPLAAFLGVLGVPVFIRREAKGFLLSLMIILGLVVFTFSYDIGEGQVQWGYLLLMYVPFAIWVGMGVDGLARLLERRVRILYVVLVITMAVVLGWQGYRSYEAIGDLRHGPLDIYRQALRGEMAERFATSVLSLAEPGAMILSDWEQATPLLYYQLVEGQRTDITIHYPLDDWQEQVVAAGGRPVYITRHLPAVVGWRNLTSVGPLVKLQDEPSTEIPSDVVPLGPDFEGEMELAGYLFMDGGEKRGGTSFKAGEVLQLTLYWRALAVMREDYSVSLRLVDGKGSLVRQLDSLNPVLSLYPTHLWRPEEVVGDYYEMLLPRGLAEGPYHLEVSVYLNLGEGQFRNLSIVGADPPTAWSVFGAFLVVR